MSIKTLEIGDTIIIPKIGRIICLGHSTAFSNFFYYKSYNNSIAGLRRVVIFEKCRFVLVEKYLLLINKEKQLLDVDVY